MSEKDEIMWKPRKRKYMTGREYWIVTNGKGQALTTDKGVVSEYFCRENAQHWADQKNNEQRAALQRAKEGA